MLKLRQISIIFLILSIAGFCSATVMTIDADNVGWYEEGGYHYQANTIIVGVYQPTTLSENYYDHTSYLVFSVPELMDEIVEVSFSLELTYYGSDDLTEKIKISGVSTPVETLMASHTGADLRPWIYNDLKDGSELGTMEVNTGNLHPFTCLASFQEKGPVFSTDLNEIGLQTIKDAEGGQFAIGLSLTGTQGDREERISSFSSAGDPDYWVAQLQITTLPEPGTILLLVSGVIFLKRDKKN